MKFEVLMATTNQEDYSLLEKINLNFDILVCNQNAFETSFKIFECNNKRVKWYNFQEKGVGLNRNNALMRSDADICLLADDDVLYVDNLEEIIKKNFEKYPHADVILFNIYPNSEYHPFVIKKKITINKYNYGRFGGVRIAFRRKKIIKNAITFNLLFGGGAEYSAGEDNMFIKDCIRKKLRIIAVPDYILSLRNERDSTWFNGYTDKFFFDLGASYVVHYGKLASFYVVVQLIRHRKDWLCGCDFKHAKRMALRGIRDFKRK